MNRTIAINQSSNSRCGSTREDRANQAYNLCMNTPIQSRSHIDSQFYVSTYTTNPTETQAIHSLIMDCHVSINICTIHVVLIAEEVAKELQQIGLTAEYTLSADCHLSVKEGLMPKNLKKP